MKKALAIFALVATAGAASAATPAEFDRFGVDVNTLSDTQRLAIEQVIHGGGSNSDIAGIVKSLANNG